jgi:hypothetical protein
MSRRLVNLRTISVLAGAIGALAAPPARAQTERLVARADSLLAVGEVARAETLYYAAARRDTRDFAPRMALGKYLVARGAFKIGLTLLEEAMAFGADTLAIAHARTPALQVTDDWVSLAQLAKSPLTPAEKQRAVWLATNAPAIRGADSVTVRFETSSVAGLGRVSLVIGTDTLAADIDPNSAELVIGDYARYAGMVQVFSGAAGDMVAVVRRAAIGDLVFERLPARIDRELGPARARIGLTLLAKLAPTVDAAAGVLTLRRNGRVDASMGRRRVPVVFRFPGVGVARPGRFVPIESPAGRAVLAQARWTLDLKRGELVLEVDER